MTSCDYDSATPKILDDETSNGIITSYTDGVFDGIHSLTCSSRNRSRPCRYCNSMLFKHHNPSKLNGNTFECKNCGWWQSEIIVNSLQYGGPCPHPHLAPSAVCEYIGILKKFNISDKSTPIEILRNEINQVLKKIEYIEAGKMECLVGSIMKDIYRCEVLHVGQTNDGGIDLILLNSDSPIAVQVKRRQTSNHTEPVAPIREFLGAGMVGGFKKLIYVSTARRFSKYAINTANNARQRRIVDQFDLIDLKKLQSIVSEHSIVPIKKFDDPLRFADVFHNPTIAEPNAFIGFQR